jgi:hypothetical protein
MPTLISVLIVSDYEGGATSRDDFRKALAALARQA